MTRPGDYQLQNGGYISSKDSVPRTVLAFAGQGSHYPGMGLELYNAYPNLRNTLQQLDRLAQAQGFPSFLRFTLSKTDDLEQDSPVVIQLAITCLQMAFTDLLRSLGVKPDVVIGHSLGEYAALYAAGVLIAADTVHLVGKRAELLQARCERGTHAMLAIRAPVADVVADLSPQTACEVACINARGRTILAGPVSNIEKAQQAMRCKDLKCNILNVPFAFHSAQVQPILEQFEALAQGITFASPKIPILSPSLGRVIQDAGVVNATYLANHCRVPVNFLAALNAAREDSVIDDETLVVDMGPTPWMRPLFQSAFGDRIMVLPTLAPNDDVQANLSKLFSLLRLTGFEPASIG